MRSGSEIFIEAIKACEFGPGDFKADLEVGVECIAIPVEKLEEVLQVYALFTKRSEALRAAMDAEADHIIETWPGY
jgi:hypothetical protein